MAIDQPLKSLPGAPEPLEPRADFGSGHLECLTLSREDVCALVGISLSTFYRLQQARLVPPCVPGLRGRWSRKAIEQWVSGHHPISLARRRA